MTNYEKHTDPIEDCTKCGALAPVLVQVPVDQMLAALRAALPLLKAEYLPPPERDEAIALVESAIAAATEGANR